MTVSWWADIWSSPMAPEFDDSDRHGLFMLAVLVDAFWNAETPTAAKDLAAEIRQQGQRFGLSPIDRRRLQWEIERTEEAQDKGARRRAQPPAPAKPSKSAADPRSVLRAV
ncbi:MAG: gp1 [uncultured Gemmatimonadetes bacterium]|uniref:Gp1 n=1 Tax=uncultured Gemmatimonadota bacterium TaxID=203437 RepID=A0A6J4MQ99_9BACT|nr:MAG: gp1 [uncultured Gemmatimonadota bacterium]